MSSLFPSPVEQSPAVTTILSKALSDQVPPEIWRAIAALAVKPYHILLIEYAVRATSNKPLNEIGLENNHVQDMLNMCLVSKAFKEGVKSGVRNHFSGHLYFWFGNFRRQLCTLIKTKMASRVKRIEIHMFSTETPALETFRSQWSQFIRSGNFPDLQEIQVYAPYAVNYNDFEDLSEEDMENRVIEEAARIKSVVAAAGLDGNLPCAFRVYAYVDDEQLPGADFGIDPSQIMGLTGRGIAENWQRKCNIPILCQQLEWLWSVEAEPVSK